LDSLSTAGPTVISATSPSSHGKFDRRITDQ
jgi:hypothetical protein